MKKLLCIIFVFTLYAGVTEAQVSTLLLRNGKKVTISDYKVDSTDFYEGKITFINTNGKSRNMYLDEVFSITDNNGKEKVLYAPNEELGEFLSIGQMKSYIEGFSLARNAKVSPIYLIGGIGAGFVGSYIPSLQVDPRLDDGSFEFYYPLDREPANENIVKVPIGMLIPVLYLGVVGAVEPDVEIGIEDMKIQALDESYLLGYQDGVKKKRMRNGAIGTGIGILGGIITLLTFY